MSKLKARVDKLEQRAAPAGERVIVVIRGDEARLPGGAVIPEAELEQWAEGRDILRIKVIRAPEPVEAI